VKVSSATGWFAARPSGTEAIYQNYAESYRGRGMLSRVIEEAQAMVDAALG
jgi:phosphoglucomutase